MSAKAGAPPDGARAAPHADAFGEDARAATGGEGSRDGARADDDARALARLAHKYAALLALREARARGEPLPPREVFRALAAEFPRCLVELDTLPMDALVARADATARAADGRLAVAPWMRRMAAYHALSRAALYVKLRVGRGAIDDARAEAIAAAAALHARTRVDAAFVRAVAAPPEGRIVGVVLREIAARERVDAGALARELFPARPRG